MLRVLILAAGLATPITAVRPMPLGKGDAADVEIRTSDNIELAASFFPPLEKPAAGNPTPGVLMVHDAGADRHQLDDIAIKLQKAGFAVLTVDLRGHGESRGEGGAWAELDDEEKSDLWANATKDIDASAEWLLGQDAVHSTNLSVVGLGSGCALAIRHAKGDENVRCVVLMAPRSKDFGFDVAADLQKIEGLPTLVLAAKDDAETRSMVEAANGDAQPFVELDFAGARIETVLEDRKIPAKVATWIKGFAMPKRGKG